MSEDQGDAMPLKDSEVRPHILYRSFSVNPRTLAPELFTQPLIPGKPNKNDPTQISDGNELGVYMSTNPNMVQTAYTHAAIPDLMVPTEQFNDNGLVTNYIPLPVCGLVIEVDSKGLAIRKPKIRPALQGHYNNGFEGEEWIADKVPPENYRVTRLVLSRYANDNQQLTIDIDSRNPQSTQAGIEKIRNAFKAREQEAREFAEFIKGLEPSQRLNEYYVKKKWREQKALNQTQAT